MSFPNWRDDNALKLIDDFFIVFFLLEAIVKISVLGSKAYFKDSWNRFDFVLVVGSLPALLSAFLPLYCLYSGFYDLFGSSNFCGLSPT